MSVESSAFNVERSGAGRAVFLSYASQDAEAAKRIADALRATGVEVWFDQNELVGGDQWDQKIRGQIGSCALFLPLISANTQARLEGYFRLEWKIAAQRTHTMADEKTFLLPILIDDTRDADAKVPPEFRAVQWTKLPAGADSPAFSSRVKKLLAGEANPVGGVLHPDVSMKSGYKTPPARNHLAKWWWVLPIIGVTIAPMLLRKEPPKEQASLTVSQPASVAPVSEAQKLIQQARQIYEGGDEINRENIVFAEDLVKRALALDPAEPGAWELAAKLSHALVWYSLDATESRRELLMQQANRARALAPQSVSAQLVAIDARLALNFGRVAVPPDFENEVRDLVTREPGNWNAQRAWSTMLRFISGRQEESLAAIRRAVELSNGYPGVVADLINTLVRQRKYAEADAVMTKYLPLRPTGRLLCWDVILRLRWRGGPGAAQQSLTRFPTWLLQEDRGLFLAWQTWHWSRDSAKALRAAQAAQRDYVRDFSFYGPRAVLTAQAHELAGSVEAARADWQTALVRAERELATDAQTEDALYWKAWALARLGRTSEARTITAQLRQRNRDGLSAFFKGTSLAALLATTGEIDEALAEISSRLNTLDDSIGVTRPALELDPAYDAMRGDPRFVALLRQAPAPDKEKPVTAPAAEDKSVAVLAFANLSDDKNNEYFSDGISEELLNVLAKVPGLKVSARTSAFFFKGKEVPVPEIAKQLGVAYVVEGSVRKQGDKVRITAQLIKAADGFHVWSDTFTRDLKDIFAVQDEIAGLIAQSLSLQLGTSSVRKVAVVNPQAFELYVQARQAWSLRTPEGFARAEQMLNRALELAPDFVRARAALIDVVQMRRLRERKVGAFGQRHSPEIDQRLAQVRGVLALDPELAEAYSTLGQTLDSKWQRDEAGRAYRRATELNPNYATGRHWYGMHLAELGRMDEALAEVKAACDLDPFSFIILDNYGWLLSLAGRYREALQMLDRAAAINPGFDQTARAKAAALAALGRTAEAQAIARQLRNSQRELDVWTLGLVGLHDEAATLLQRMEPGDVTNRFQALLSAGQREAALTALADPSGASKGDSIDTLFQPIYDPVRTDPRFIQYLATLGLVEAHTRAQAWRRSHPPEKPGKAKQ
jgi:TolB-like protein/Tfp pilus assembly protein PilF